LDRFYGALLVLGAALPFIYDPARQAFCPPVTAGNGRSFAGEMQPKIGWESKIVLQVVINPVIFRYAGLSEREPPLKAAIILI
jgi:hypothetical protein